MTISISKEEDTEQFQNWTRNNNSYGNPPWKTEAALRLHPLCRDSLLGCWRARAALKPKSSTTQCCWGDREGLAISKRLFTGLRLIFLFLDIPEETRKLLGPGTLTEGTLTGTYSTRPSSTILQILTPDRDAESSEDGLMPPTAYHCSCESLTALHRSTAWFTQAQTSATTCDRDAVQVAPWFKSRTVGDAVTNSCRLSQHSDARVRKEVSLGEVRTSHEILHAKQSATHLILADHDSIQIDDELFAGSHWPTYNESWQLEVLENKDDLFLAQTVTRLYYLWSWYVI